MSFMVHALFALLVSSVCLMPSASCAMSSDGCGAGKCTDCHTMSMDEAKGLLKGLADDIGTVKLSEVGGLWEIEIESKGNRFPIYIDFSKQFLVTGQVIRLATRENITQKRMMELNTVDVAQIPLDDAIVIGNPKAKRRVIVFDDPECPFCIKLHGEIKQAVKKDPSVAFYIKMYPLPIHPKSYEKAKAIVCEKSLKLLEDSFDGKDLPAPECKGDAVDNNIELGKKIGVRSTPTLVLPNGLVVPGYKSADDILKLLDMLDKAAAPEQEPKPKPKK
ncbi:MAG: DsbC family protein [Nitrospirae bacterium]|nr:DsbC family protein [Nitrospirota bacterium]